MLTQCQNVFAALLITGASLFSIDANAVSGNYERELAATGIPDLTPQQQYRSAIREAGGAYKESLRDCAGLRGPEKSSCVREAKATYDRDMAEARALLRGGKS